VIKELKEPAQRETLGVYSPSEAQTATTRATVPDLSLRAATEDSSTAVADQKEEEDQPRRRKR